MWYIWLIIAGIFFIVEIITVGFLVFWLGIGALLAMIVSFFTDSLPIQIAVFAVSSSTLIPLTKPLVNKFINGKTVQTNVNAIINKHGVVTVEVNGLEGKGQIKVNGEIWSAKSINEQIIPVGTKVNVLKVDGVKAIVETL